MLLQMAERELAALVPPCPSSGGLHTSSHLEVQWRVGRRLLAGGHLEEAQAAAEQLFRVAQGAGMQEEAIR